jgi:carbon-monoxide dehydrogenase medium subunit
MRNITHYFKPKTVEEACKLFRETPGKGQFIGGGTQVAIERDSSLEYLVDLSYCGLNSIEEQNGNLCIGACANLEDVSESDLVTSFANGLIREVARWTGSTQLRIGGTVGGSLVVKADIALALMALDAQVVIAGDAERTVALSDFYTESGSVLADGEIIKEVIVPLEFRNAAAKALRQSRTRQDVSTVGVATVLLKENDTCKKARIAVLPVRSGVARVSEAEALLEGKALTDDVIQQVATAVSQNIPAVDDFRASADYRKKVIGVYTKRALAAC